MSKLNILEDVEIELGKVRRTAARVEDPFIVYLIDMTILAVKRKAISECKDSKESARGPARRVAQLA